MHPLAATFEAGRARLAANPAVAALANPETSTSAKLAVVPTMSFWVLGFGDAMALIRRTGGDTPLDGVVRQHAMEDAEHWRWFVADLESLASRGVGARSVGDALLRQWGPETAPVRECAWTVHHLLRAHTDPVVRLAILEACEHGFEAFMDSMRPVVQASGQYTELRYLGAVHDSAEASHALHEADDPFEDVDWSGRDVDALRLLVETVYDRLDGMHACYAVAIAAAREEECGA
jgi:hypothetical protein